MSSANEMSEKDKEILEHLGACIKESTCTCNEFDDCYECCTRMEAEEIMKKFYPTVKLKNDVVIK
jgi:hypothetical protein